MLNVNFIPRNEFARTNLECLPHSETVLVIRKVVHGTELLEFLDKSKPLLVSFTRHTAAVHP